MIHTEEIKIKDGSLAVKAMGRGPTIIFVSGGPGVCGPLYEETLRPLFDKNTFIFWSYAGCGSSKVQNRNYSMAGDYEDLNSIVTQSGEPVVLMGHSYGGLLAIKYASKHPTLVKGIVLINSMTSFSHGPESLAKKRNRLKELGLEDQYFQLGEQVFSGLTSAETQNKFWILESKLQVYNQNFSSIVANKLQPSFEVVAAMQVDLMQADYCNEFRKLKMPVLIIAGLHDLIALRRPQEMHSLLMESTLHEYQNSGHMPFLEENELFIHRTENWLQSNLRQEQ